ncbi:helix-turn-helix domain-containing protein [Nocardioides ultimimeridianus]
MSTVSNAKPGASGTRRDHTRLLSVEEVAEYLAIPVATLYQWRHKGCGPAAYRVGRHLRYEPAAVDAWLQQHLDVRSGPQ